MLAYGISASVVYGIILYVVGLFEGKAAAGGAAVFLRPPAYAAAEKRRY